MPKHSQSIITASEFIRRWASVATLPFVREFIMSLHVSSWSGRAQESGAIHTRCANAEDLQAMMEIEDFRADAALSLDALAPGIRWKLTE